MPKPENHINKEPLIEEEVIVTISKIFEVIATGITALSDYQSQAVKTVIQIAAAEQEQNKLVLEAFRRI